MDKELADKINALQAQNIALMVGMAILMRSIANADRADLRKQYDVQCASFQVMSSACHAPQELTQQRIEFDRIGEILFSY
jgi:hypothetical protein